MAFVLPETQLDKDKLALEILKRKGENDKEHEFLYNRAGSCELGKNDCKIMKELLDLPDCDKRS